MQRHSIAATLCGAAARDRHARRFVAGVRFRAWHRPTACTRPSACIAVVFDIHDAWSGRSIGGALSTSRIPADATTTLPVNANEAEARRRARYAPMGHSQGDMKPPRRLDNPDYPLTLDLRRA